MSSTVLNQHIIDQYLPRIDAETVEFLQRAVAKIVECKRRGGKVVVATGSGPNLHEGVTTLIAELMGKGLIDGVLTSSAVIAHEMAGTLDRVKRVDGRLLDVDPALLPRGSTFEYNEMSDAEVTELRSEMAIDDALIARCRQLAGTVIIKAAGNMAYPMGLRSERLAREIMTLAQTYALPFEAVAGWGADPRTMIGAGARLGLPVLVSVPQLIGGGAVGLAIADSLSITQRCMKIAQLLASADVIIESAVALTQEIHDGPFETYTGHGIWAGWDGLPTYSLAGKTLVRIDLDPNLKQAWLAERQSQTVQEAINLGLPKTKLTGIPFRMEMSGFARLEGSLPVIGDIGLIWPVLACQVAEALGVQLDFVSHPQQTPEGKAMREWIVEQVRPIRREEMLQVSRRHREAQMSEQAFIKRDIRYQGAIIRDHHILLIRHREHDTGRSYWLFPGGGREEGESEEECVRREMHEETNLLVRVERLLMEQPASPTGPYRLRRTFLCSILAGTPTPGYEPEEDASVEYGIVEVAWFDLRDEQSWHEVVRANEILYPQMLYVQTVLGY